ncbi:MAG: alpha/beta hydrolase [Solirubrobacterales bacterium]|nr:alpha/beta hydrolase [Solirubrobacterales bacterium]
MSGLVFRESRPEGEPRGTMLCVHGYPESSWMWNHVLEAAAAAGWHAVAPDLPGYGDTPPDPPGTWERHVEALDRFVDDHDLAPVVLAVHDWGGLIGLRWACERGDGRVRGLVISNTGFFPDGKWHGMAQAMRTEGQGEQFVEGIDAGGFAGMMRGISPGMDDRAIAEYWKGFDGPERRRGHLEMYRSGDFEKLEGLSLAALGVPALLLWGGDDPFAPVAGAHRFAREIPGAELTVLDGVGHFVFDDAADEAAAAVASFLARL